MDESFTPEAVDGHDKVFGGINLLTRSLHDVDDRGLVLSLAAFAEDALGSLLKAFMLPSEATMQLLEGFNAPLGTLSSRIKAAYAMGLTTMEQFQDLERLRKIRNEFAHSWRPLSLSQPKLAALVAGMNYSRIDDEYPKTPVEKVRASMTCLLIELRSAAEQLPKRGAQARLTGTHFISGFAGLTFKAQLGEARSKLAEIQKALRDASGEELAFYEGLLKRFPAKVTLLHAKTPEDREELATFQEEVRGALRENQS
jgi:hypothetical protein